MNHPLPSHLSIQEINYFNLESQYKTWISHLRFLNTEFSHFSEILSAKKMEELLFDSTLSQNLSLIKEENELMLDKVINYGNQLESLRECEDVACDTFYLNDHQRFKNEIEKHIEKVRNFKNSFYKTLVSEMQ